MIPCYDTPPQEMTGRLDIQAIAQQADRFSQRLGELKGQLGGADLAWYPYDSLGNFTELERLLTGRHRDLAELIGRDPVLDLGCGDGAVAFFLESLGFQVRAIDHAPTNFNRMRGVAALRAALGSSIEVQDLDLDAPFILRGGPFGAVFLFGLLYHLKNPFYVLETLARQARYCFLSTRIARFTPDGRVDLSGWPVAYLLDSREANQDPTNYWIFSEAGLRRLLQRTGWEIRDFRTAGQTAQSDPRRNQADERAFCLARSTVLRRTLTEAAPAAWSAGAAPKTQLLAGWHQLEQGVWRWTERRFSIALRVPARGGQATLKLRFTVPEPVLASLGPVTLGAAANGAQLPSATYSQAGEHVYSAELPGETLSGEVVTVAFELDRALAPSASDPRELGVVVSSVELS